MAFKLLLLVFFSNLLIINNSSAFTVIGRGESRDCAFLKEVASHSPCQKQAEKVCSGNSTCFAHQIDNCMEQYCKFSLEQICQTNSNKIGKIFRKILALTLIKLFKAIVSKASVNASGDTDACPFLNQVVTATSCPGEAKDACNKNKSDDNCVQRNIDSCMDKRLCSLRLEDVCNSNHGELDYKRQL